MNEHLACGIAERDFGRARVTEFHDMLAGSRAEQRTAP